MTRHKGVSSKKTITREDLAELVDCMRRIQRIESSLCYTAPQKLPLMAASVTVKACWAELSGEAMAWSFPSDMIDSNGRLKGRTPIDEPERTVMKTDFYGKR